VPPAQGIRINYLNNKMILIDMEAIAVTAFPGNSRAHYFTESIIVRGNDAELIFYFRPHLFGPGFAAEKSIFQMQGIDVDIHLDHRIGKKKGVAWSADKGGGFKILQNLDLAFGVAAGNRDNGGTDPFGAVM
jgi:hypothetical protein